jgi:transposase
MVVFGVDPHKHSHTVVAVDEAGRKLGQLTVSSGQDGQLRLLRWARQLGSDRRRWAVGRMAGMWPAGWSLSCWALGRRWCGCRPS